METDSTEQAASVSVEMFHVTTFRRGACFLTIQVSDGLVNRLALFGPKMEGDGGPDASKAFIAASNWLSSNPGAANLPNEVKLEVS